MKILLVEDDVFLQELYHDLLKTEGFDVTSSMDGKDALAKMQSGGWDLVLLDLNLPSLGGLEIAESIQNQPPANSNKTVVFLTNSDDIIARKRAAEYGYEYLIKSELQPDEFIQTIKTYLQK